MLVLDRELEVGRLIEITTLRGDCAVGRVIEFIQEEREFNFGHINLAIKGGGSPVILLDHYASTMAEASAGVYSASFPYQILVLRDKVFCKAFCSVKVIIEWHEVDLKDLPLYAGFKCIGRRFDEVMREEAV